MPGTFVQHNHTATHGCTCGAHPMTTPAVAFDVGHPPTTAPMVPTFVPDAPLATDAQRAQLERPIEWEGGIVVEGLMSGDGRIIDPGALVWRDLPLPLMLLDHNSAGGHDEAVFSGLITRGDRRGNAMWAQGVFDQSPAGAQHRRLVESGALPWVSIDMDMATIVFEEDTSAEPEYDPWFDEYFYPLILRFTSARIMGVTGVAFPAFQEARIQVRPLDEVRPVIAADAGGRLARRLPSTSSTGRWNVLVPAADIRPVTASRRQVVAATGQASVTGGPGFPDRPALRLFDNPRLVGPTHLQVIDHPGHDDHGHVLGHIALWESCHVGFANECVSPPRSANGYASYATGSVPCSDGTAAGTGVLYCPATVGQLFHPPAELSDTAMLSFFARYGSAAADVAIGEDEWGIWVAGAMRGNATWQQVRELCAGDVSGHWVDGALLAITAVDQGGFDVPAGVRFTLAADASVHYLAGAGRVPLFQNETRERAGGRLEALERRLAAVEDVTAPARRDHLAALLERVKR